MTGHVDRTHDPRITVIQQELFNENRSKADKYRELFIGRPGLGALIAYEASRTKGESPCGNPTIGRV